MLKAPAGLGGQDLLVCLSRDVPGVFVFESETQTLFQRIEAKSEILKSIACLDSMGLVVSASDKGVVRLCDVSATN